MTFHPVLVDAVLLAVGLGLVYLAAEALVRGAARLARGLGVTTVVIGLTVVAFGTSAPEMVIGAVAALEGAEGIALGNVVGSNIVNVGLVLGGAALLKPVAFGDGAAVREVVATLASAGLLVALALDGTIGLLDGVVLLVGIVAFLAYALWSSRHGEHALGPTDLPEGLAADLDWSRDAPLVVGGMVGVAAGAWLTVEGAAGMATRLGAPEVVIGLTVVALGTSLPEVATSFVAALREEGDISVGNVVGSNLFNTLAVLGLVAVIAPVPVDPGTLRIGLPVMVGFTLALAPFLSERFVLDRRMGLALVVGFALFWGYLIWVGAGWVV